MDQKPVSQTRFPRLRNRLPTGFILGAVSIWAVLFALTPTLAHANETAITALKEKIEANPKSMGLVLQLAEQYARAGQHDKATALLWKHVDRLDQSGFRALMKSHEARKEWLEVIRAANLVIAKNPKNEEALTMLGNAHFMRGKRDEAKEALKRALEVNKMYQPAYDVLIRIYEGNNPYEQRLLLQDMVELFGPKPMFLTKLCTLNTMDGENEQGEKVCQQAIKKNGDIPENHVHLGLIAKQKGEPDKARTLLRTAASEFPKSEYAQYEAASFFEAEKNYIDAFKYYERCVAADPQSERCQMGVGNNGVQLEKYEKAYNAFKIACGKSGRKNASAVRRAWRTLQSRKSGEWTSKYELLAERCAGQ